MTTMNYRLPAALAAFALAGALGASPALGQQAFPTAEGAAKAFVDALATNDDAAVANVLGRDYRRLLPPSDAGDKTRFLEAVSRGQKVQVSGDRALLEVGRNGWTLPIPIVRTAAGWRFDTRGAAEEMRVRRIGRNELAAMLVSLAYVDAQREYAARDWDGDGVKSYAAKGLSSPGKRDGLYWASLPDEPASPLGAQFAEARAGQPFHGYYYRILSAQGASAPGGAKSYLRDGRMTGGFALIAWPAKYGDSGVMSFIVNQDGVVYEKDLGATTATVAAAVKAFDPGAGWQKADVPKP